MYAKVFSQIFDSSIADDRHLRHFFMDLLVLANSDGVVDMTPSAIAARTRTPIEEVNMRLAMLESPDPESRTPDHDGRRIARLDEHRSWGWVIINYDKFRMIASEEQRKATTRERVKRYRLKIKDVTPCNAPVTPCNAGNAMQKEKQIQKERETEGLEVELPDRFPKTEEEAKMHAQFAGTTPEFAVTTWNLAMGRGGRDSRGQPISSFRHYLKSQQAFALGSQKPKNVFPEQQLRAIEKEISRHPANKESTHYCGNPTQEMKDGLKKLQEKHRTINSQIANA